MRKFMLSALISLVSVIACLTFSSCKKSAGSRYQDNENSQIESIRLMGFDVSNIRKAEGGYMVEGDIMMTDEFIHENGGRKLELCYSTPLVTGLPRTIAMRAAPGLSSSWISALDLAILRYNNIGLRLRFQRVSSGGNIVVSPSASLPVCASSGFPSGGNPYSSILVSTFCNNYSTCVLAALLFHEIGHCIGVRHTDWYNPALSCGGTPVPGPVPSSCNNCSATDTLSIFNTCLPSTGCPVATACDIAGLRAIYQ